MPRPRRRRRRPRAGRLTEARALHRTPAASVQALRHCRCRRRGPCRLARPGPGGRLPAGWRPIAAGASQGRRRTGRARVDRGDCAARRRGVGHRQRSRRTSPSSPAPRHVHLGQDDLPVADARALARPGRRDRALHPHAGQVDEACALPIDYLAVGPVFGTQTKATGYDGGRTRAASAARAAAQDAPASPVVAIGGITLDTASEVIEAGADAVAVITRPAAPSGRRRARAFCAPSCERRQPAYNARQRLRTTRRLCGTSACDVSSEAARDISVASSLFRTKSIDRLLAEGAATGEGTLKRTLSSGALIALGIGAIIGAGLFVRTAAAIADRAGPGRHRGIPGRRRSGAPWPGCATPSSRR